MDASKPAVVRKKGRRRTILLHIIGMVIFFGSWELSVRTGMLSQRVMATPSQVVEVFIFKLDHTRPDGATVISHFLVSFRLALNGFVVAVLIGIPIGLFTGYFKTLDLYMTPIFEIVRPIPPIAWIPIVILVLGIGMTAKVFIIFVAAFVPCVINSYLGVKLTNQTLINLARTFGASDWQIFRTVCVPSSMPMIFAGVRTSLGASWSTLVAAEMLASTGGLGYMIQMGRTLIRPDIIIVGMLTIGFTGAIMAKGLAYIERRIAPWRNRK
jgi:NitT/TauT family transport system permease protein